MVTFRIRVNNTRNNLHDLEEFEGIYVVAKSGLKKETLFVTKLNGCCYSNMISDLNVRGKCLFFVYLVYP